MAVCADTHRELPVWLRFHNNAPTISRARMRLSDWFGTSETSTTIATSDGTAASQGYRTVGDDVGLGNVGALVGENVGDRVGLGVVGANVGTAEGAYVGNLVGAAVGDLVGGRVGTFVGGLPLPSSFPKVSASSV